MPEKTKPECPECHRPLPREKPDDPPARSVFAVSEPPGEHGVLVDLLEQAHDRLQASGCELTPVGEKKWKYGVLAYLLYAVATAPADVVAQLAAREEG